MCEPDWLDDVHCATEADCATLLHNEGRKLLSLSNRDRCVSYSYSSCGMRVHEKKGEAGSGDQMEGQVFIVEDIAETTPWKLSVQLRGSNDCVR